MSITRPLSAIRGVDRRDFIGLTVGAAAAGCGWTRSLPAGVFAGTTDRLRIGLVGCGGRGTGAALHALQLDRGSTVTHMADLFADQIASSAAILAAGSGHGFDCPPERRHVGPDAWRRVIDADVDLVILATPPCARPDTVAAAVAAGRHVFCEKPAAIDVAGVGVVAEAAAAARRAGLSLVSGLCLRHDAAMREWIGRIHDGVVGRPLQVAVHASTGAPWSRPAEPGRSAAEHRMRNWIAHVDLSGGHLVEHHVHALDAALWALGDETPDVATPLAWPPSRPVPDRGCAAETAVRFGWRDGRSVTAVISRRETTAPGRDETLQGTAGRIGLRPATLRGCPWRAAMATLLGAIRAGTPANDGSVLCRATLTAVMGRLAAETGRPVDRPGVLDSSLPIA